MVDRSHRRLSGVPAYLSGKRRRFSIGIGALMAITAVGVATGTHREFDRGTVPAGKLEWQLACGAATLVLGVLAIATWERGGGLARTTMGFCFLLIWILWAYLRVGLYAS